MQKPDNKVIEELKAQHGKLIELEYRHPFTAEVSTFIAKLPGAEWQRFMDEMLDENKRGRALEKFVKSCVVYPEAKEVSDFIKQYPACVSSLSGVLSKHAGANAEVESRVL